MYIVNMNFGRYEETVKSNQSMMVSNYILDPSYKVLHNDKICQQTPPGFSCRSTHEKLHNNIDDETNLLRGQQSFGIIQKPTVKNQVQSPKINKLDNQLPFGNNYVTRQSKSEKSISLMPNDRYVEYFPENHTDIQTRTPLVDVFSLFGVDTRQAVKYASNK